MRRTPSCRRIARRLIHTTARLWESILPSRLLDAPRRSQHLPQNDRLFQKAQRGDDKAMLLVNTLLVKRQGSCLEQEALLKYITGRSSLAWARWAGTVSVVGCTVTKSYAALADAVRNWRAPFLGVRVSFDDSRVASLECCVGHVFAAGVMATAPVQVKPDQPAMLQTKAALATFEHIIKGGGGGRRAPVASRTRAPAMATFLAVTNMLFSLLPIQNYTPFLPSSVDKPDFHTTRLFDKATGSFFMEPHDAGIFLVHLTRTAC